jgi:hypothetical protein
MHSIEQEIMAEFNHLLEIAQEIIVLNQHKNLTMTQFLQLTIDIRNAERDTNLDGKIITLPEKDTLQ